MTAGLLVFDASFYQRAALFAQRHPHYQGKGTIATRWHISRAVEACGFDEVTPDNIDAVFAALEARAVAKEVQA